jgi:hypothetical protein
MNDSAPCSIALVTTWSGDLWGLRQELVPWLTYHAVLGISRLYVLYEGSDHMTLHVRALSGLGGAGWRWVSLSALVRTAACPAQRHARTPLHAHPTTHPDRRSCMPSSRGSR